ncbi:sterol desaturase/sphingolipid hydroxylase (fatty acid hydroxylase superfamily) [Roseibium hamelinense]|uniref:Sterol desaturase/sphingolipid hydroxylase (Fatty acid hydroxylase superfamily) n=1 Tax=Roseibium hamelinense TaxID=150831 RepID=A0A562SH00_9HYPH|nr:sterol desaturase family protein [Roseibium hamelinense]MTI44142.1 fatty acid hydroxylase family protein [Roseibium hamelinense]TWI80076.1 sterol desaturase/sphingolipid hydroxylase (fatty acid hydroxylase superfamily) [Roseibium hamelinense]
MSEMFQLFAGAGWLGFAGLCTVLYAASLTILFATRSVMTLLNRRHPKRKIQKRAPSHQARKDILSSMRQLAVTSVCLSIGLFAQAKGWTLFAPVDVSWWSVPLFFCVSLLLHDTWFYWGHRILHTRMFYRFHKPHHMTITPTVWSNDAGSTVDTLFAHSYYALVLFVLPIPPLVFLGHRLFDQVSAAIGHCGYEHFASASARKPWPLLCTLYHDQHHQYFVYNYANYFSFWDRWCGTIHPTYDDKVVGFENIYAQQRD